MLIPTIEFHHRLHRFPFAAQSLTGEDDCFWCTAGWPLSAAPVLRSYSCRHHSHQCGRWLLMQVKVLSQFQSRKKSAQLLTWVKSMSVELGEYCSVSNENYFMNNELEIHPRFKTNHGRLCLLRLLGRGRNRRPCRPPAHARRRGGRCPASPGSVAALKVW